MHFQPLVSATMINAQHVGETTRHVSAFDSSNLLLSLMGCAIGVLEVPGTEAGPDVVDNAVGDELDIVGEVLDDSGVELVMPAEEGVDVVDSTVGSVVDSAAPSSTMTIGDDTLATDTVNAGDPIVSSSWDEITSVISLVSLEASKAPTSSPVAVKVMGASPGTSMPYANSTRPL